jgi:HEAT repeat protein
MVFKPGVSGNPGGRAKGIAALAREHTDRAIDVLAKGLDSDDERIRLAAANSLLDRGFGKPIAMTADVTKAIDDYSDDEIADLLATVRAAREDREAGSGDRGEATSH